VSKVILSRSNGGGNTPWRLVEEIIALSVANTWGEAKLEWRLGHVFFTDPDDPGTCLCGHSPIRECCVITNCLNGNSAVVGNCCVKRFLGLPSGPIFAGLRRVAQDAGKALGAAAIEHAYKFGWISRWEYDFYHDTLRRRRLTPKQRAKRTEINVKVLARAGAAFGKEVARA
jgi:hypothetical protein